MSKNFNFLTRLVACVAFVATAVSCTEADDTTSSINPTLASITVDSESLTETTAEVTFKFSNSTQINFAIVKGSEEDFDTTSVSFQVIEVETSATTATATVSGLSADTSYVIGAFAENSSSSSSLVYTEFTTTASSSGGTENPNDDPSADTTAPFVSFALNADGTAITASVKNATELLWHMYEAGNVPLEGSFTWEEVEISADGDTTINIESLTTGSWVIEGYAQESTPIYGTDDDGNETIVDETVVLGETVQYEFNYESAIDSYFTVTEIKHAPFMVSATIDMEEDYCQAIAIDICPSSYWNYNGFIDAAESGSASYTLMKDGTVTYDDNPNTDNALLAPNTSYSIGAIALASDSYGWVTRGSAFYEVVTTDACEVGVADDVVTIAIDSEATTTGSLTVSVTRTDDSTVGYIVGYAKKIEVTSDITTWINETNWFDANSYTVALFDTEDTATATINELANTTEYEVFAMGISDDGYLGAIASDVASTTAVLAEDAMAFNVSVEVSMYTATFTVEFVQNCQQVSYYNTPAVYYGTEVSDASGESELKYYEKYYNVKCNGAESATITISNLSKGTDYKFFYRGLSTDGDYSEIQKIEYTTLSTNAYDSAAAVTATFEAAEANDYENAVVTYAVEYNTDTTKMLYGVVDYMYAWGLTDDSTAEEFGDILLKSGYKEQVAPYLTFTLIDDESVGVIIPVDADGKYGTPVVLKFDDWASIGL